MAFYAAASSSTPTSRLALVKKHGVYRTRSRPNISVSAIAEETDASVDLKTLPVDKGIPFIGNVIGYSGKDGDMRDKFAKYGRAFVMRTGPRTEVLCIDDPEDITAVLNSKAFMPAWPPSVMRMLAPERGSINNSEARPWRAALANITSPSAVNHMLLPLFAPAFEQHLRSIVSSSAPVRWVDTSRRLAFGVASRAIMGSLITEEEIDLLYHDYVVYAQGAFQTDFGLEGGLPFTAYSKGCAARQRLLDFLGPRIVDAVANRDSLSGDLLITKLMDHMSAQGLTAFGNAARTWPIPQSEQERQTQLAKTLMGEAVMLMFAGTDTTAYSLTAALPLLYIHPEWLAALNEEQDRVVAKHGERIGRKAIEASAVATAIAQETVRLKQAVKSTYRVAIQPAVVAGVQVPPGTVVQAYWHTATLATGPGVEEFRPEYWLSADRCHCSMNNDPNSMQFGAGARVCVGKYLAVSELVTALAIIGRLVSSIDMDPDDSTRVVTLVKGHPTGIPTILHPRL